MYKNICAIPECEYDVQSVLVVHHRDKNRNHHNIENLLILCPTHHAEIHYGMRDATNLKNKEIVDTWQEAEAEA